MSPDEYQQYCSEQAPDDAEVCVGVDSLDARYGTLMLGYHVDRSTLHVYLADGEIHAVTYIFRFGEVQVLRRLSGRALPAHELVPSKRAYPQHTDRRFARVMRDLGHPLPFTAYTDTGKTCPMRGER